MNKEKKKNSTARRIIKIVLITFTVVLLLLGGGIFYIMKSTGINRLPNKIEFFNNDEMEEMEEENLDGENQIIKK
ncbi:hypothetical protein I6N96_13240 [Enterococcus sp. BWM-S5]|uniref:DUF4044 domain-containing protein n=1 Tax=Enterococcus larvae TaxID=2794352 RepID=A0ABS4CL11_9ENTE|nr:hypothetical protein [Enterococcus larvae]MBP1047241.1 hypothetical protein [Enterococcus larvae]